MKNIKKWQVVIIGIALYISVWSVNNPWYFENKIEVSNYEEFINDTKWESSKRDSIWTFNENGDYSEIWRKGYGGEKGSWKVKDNIIVTEARTLQKNIQIRYSWKITKTTKNYMWLRSTLGFGSTYDIKLKRL